MRSRHAPVGSEPTLELIAEAFGAAPIPAAIVVCAEPARPVFEAVNDALCELVGRDRDDLMSQSPSDVIVGVDDLPGWLTAGATGAGVEAHCRHAGGHRIAVVLTRAALGGSSPPAAILQVQEVARDEQLERALRESEHRLRELVDNVNALIYVKRADGHFILVNRHFEEMFGVGREDARTRTYYDFFPPSIAAVYTAHDRRVLETGEAMQFEEPRTDGGAWLSVKFPLVDEDGRPYAVGGISTDITPRRRMEAAIREAKDDAEGANRAKSEYLSRMSHELRTPLNSILGLGQLLQMERLPPSAADCVDRIVSAGRHLLALINDALDISRIEEGRQSLSIEPLHVCDPLIEALDLIAPIAREREIEIVRDLHGGLFRFVLADYQRLKQVFLNVVTNAVKYNRTRGSVRVSFASGPGDHLRVRIADTGPGLSPEQIAKVFQPFERLAADRTEIEGTGLGLALSRALIEAMGGEIGVEESLVGGGTVFYVDLVLTDKPDEVEPESFFRGAEAAATPASLAAGTVLYIEDNLANLDLVERIFARVGAVTLIPAMQGRLGIELAKRHRPDLILLDLHLPDVEGDEVLAQLKGDEATRGVPVIVLSADATPGQIARLKEGGAADYITKPIDVPAFLEAVRRELQEAPS
jgi:PAS domain S-box-containing protein